MRNFYRGELSEFKKNLTPLGYLDRAAEKADSWWQFYLGPLLTLPLLALPWVISRKAMLLPSAICVAMIVGFAVQTWTLPHYFSPATGALYILLTGCLRQFWLWRRKSSNTGKDLVRAIILLACAMIVLRVTAAALHVPIEPPWPRGNLDRARIVNQLEHLPGKQLVIVSYEPGHNLNEEWVYNRADIDASKIIWARDLGNSSNQDLLDYFPGRKVWRLDADDRPPNLESYEASR
jgi:hypothetical protein